MTLLGTSLTLLLGDGSYVAEHCIESGIERVENRYGTGQQIEKNGGRLER